MSFDPASDRTKPAPTKCEVFDIAAVLVAGQQVEQKSNGFIAGATDDFYDTGQLVVFVESQQTLLPCLSYRLRLDCGTRTSW